VSSERGPAQPSVNHKSKPGKKHRGRRRSVPQRTCIGCRAVRSKRDLLRVVRIPDGTVEIDSTGRRPGRGAYLCQHKSCWEKALKRRSLDRALKTTLDSHTRAALARYAETLPERPEIVPGVSGEEKPLTNLDGEETL
jgi:predicted RNA-binding protein YlxR (DUF448 family)